MATRSPAPLSWAHVTSLLQDASDPAQALFYKQSAPTSGKVLGIKVPALRTMVKDFVRATPELTVSDAVAMADLAFTSACREEMLFASFLLSRFKSKLPLQVWPRISRWIEGIDNWEACDQLAMGVAGEMVARAVDPQREAYLRDLVKWAGDRNPWRRRVAIATTTQLNQKGRSDAAAALRVCARVVADDDKSVRKALEWALREACKSDAPAVLAFLKQHKDEMPRTVLRGSAEKLSPSQRTALGIDK